MARERRRMSMAEYQRETASKQGSGWQCSHCGCAMTSVIDTRYTESDPRYNGYAKRRVRVCRHCKRPAIGFTDTLEIAVPDGHRVVILPEEE